MDAILTELESGLPDAREFATVIVRLVAAAILGAIVGIQREQAGKPAGIRTHMLVSMGGALTVIASLEIGMNTDGISRVIQGLVTGIGFIGGGAILKLEKQHQIEGLTTAAGIWMTTAVGITAGLGRLGAAALGAVLTLVILGILGAITYRLERKQDRKAKSDG